MVYKDEVYAKKLSVTDADTEQFVIIEGSALVNGRIHTITAHGISVDEKRKLCIISRDTVQFTDDWFAKRYSPVYQLNYYKSPKDNNTALYEILEKILKAKKGTG